MNRLTSTEAATVTAKGRNHSPAPPPMKATGTNTATMDKRGRGDGETDLRGAVARRGHAVLAAFHVPDDVLAHHDGVVDEHADGQRQAQQGHEVQREAAQPHGDERGDGRGGQRQAGDQRGAPGVQEGVHHEDGEAGAEDQRMDHVVETLLGLFTAVVRDFELGAFGQRLVDLLDFFAHALGHGYRAGLALADHRQADVRPARTQAVAAGLGEAVFDGGDLAEAHHFVALALDHDVVEIAGRLRCGRRAGCSARRAHP